MSFRLINRVRLTVFTLLLLSYASFGPLLYGLDILALEYLAIFTLLNIVAIYALLPLFMPWIADHDIREIQAVLTGLKQGNFRVPITVTPQPHDPDDENELNRLKRDIERMRAGIHTREEMVYRQSKRILKLNEALRHEAITDKLTGLFNSRHFWERMEIFLADYRRYGTAFAVVILDIDFFKKVNDTFGHLGGDRVLAHLGALLRGSVRETDLAARLGGEEFALILPTATKATAVAFLQRLIEQLRTNVIILDDGRRIHITASVGYTIVSRPDSPGDNAAWVFSSQDILKRADDALYWVKRNGRNAVKAWEDLRPPCGNNAISPASPKSTLTISQSLISDRPSTEQGRRHANQHQLTDQPQSASATICSR